MGAHGIRLTGNSPYSITSHGSELDSILNTRIDYKRSYWNRTSPEGKGPFLLEKTALHLDRQGFCKSSSQN